MIIGVGIDLVEIKRIRRILDKWGDRFTERVYSSQENDYCLRKAEPAIHYAARFAVKESFLKAFGIGLGMGVRMRDIGVRNNHEGKPELTLYGRAQDMLAERSVSAVHVTMTHTKEYAMAAVILEREGL